MAAWTRGRVDGKTGGGAPAPRRARSAAFTLIEILVVAAIMMLVALIALPSFSRAMQGQRLRGASRLVVTAHKYARNLSVLRQQPMAILFDRLNHEVEIVAVADRAALSGQDGFLQDRAAAYRLEPEADRVKKAKAADEDEEPRPPEAIASEELRALPPGVQIRDFESGNQQDEKRGVYWVTYYPSGMSDGFTVTLADERNRTVSIKADPISGTAEVDFEEKR